MDWVAGFLTLLSIWLVGRRERIGWGVSLLSQLPWFWVIWSKEAWGLIPLQMGLCVLALYNWFTWRGEEDG